MAICPECKVGETTPIKTVIKEGPNKGRKFISCTLWKEGCKYFYFVSDMAQEVPKAYVQPSNKGLEYAVAKDKRISFLSIFKTLPEFEIHQKNIDGVDGAVKEAFEIVEELYKRYPLPTDDSQPFQ